VNTCPVETQPVGHKKMEKKQMKKEYLTAVDFRPYTIHVETLEEHQFLIGMFEGDPNTKKCHSRNYNSKIEAGFYDVIEQGIDDE